jgi:hypothetical protein
MSPVESSTPHTVCCAIYTRKSTEVERLRQVAAQFGGDNAPRFGIVADDSKIDLVAGVQNAHLGALGRRLSLIRLALTEIRDRLSQLP